MGGINGIQWGQRGYPFVPTWCQVFREHINLFVNIFMHACMAIVGSKYTFSIIRPRPTMYHIDLYIDNRESAAIMPTLEPQYCCPHKNCLVFLWVCKIERSTVGINGIQWGQRGYPFLFTWCQVFREHINLFVNIFIHACMAIVGS